MRLRHNEAESLRLRHVMAEQVDPNGGNIVTGSGNPSCVHYIILLTTTTHCTLHCTADYNALHTLFHNVHYIYWPTGLLLTLPDWLTLSLVLYPC